MCPHEGTCGCKAADHEGKSQNDIRQDDVCKADIWEYSMNSEKYYKTALPEAEYIVGGTWQDPELFLMMLAHEFDGKNGFCAYTDFETGKMEIFGHAWSFDEDEDFIYDDFRKTNSFGGSSLNLPILIVSIILLVLLAVLAYCIFYIPANNGVSAQEYLKEIFETLFRG